MKKLGTGAYLQEGFLKLIPQWDNIKIIFELGSRDALDAIDLAKFFQPEMIYSFECNPKSARICRGNIMQHAAKNVYLCELAVGDEEGIFPFYETDMDKSFDKNIGASSMLMHKDNKRDYFQKEINVRMIRLDRFIDPKIVPVIDLLSMDIQGYEKKALIGLGERLKDVRFIITELSDKSFYEGDVLAPELIEFLSQNNFEMVKRIGDDAMFKNRRFQ